MSIGIGPFLSKSPAVSSSVSKSRSKPSEEAEWSAGGLTSNGRRDSDVVCPRSPHASRSRSGVPGVCSRTLGGLIPNALGMSPVTFIGVRSVAAASTWAAARKGSKIFPSGHSTAEASAMTARVRCAEVVSSPLGTRAMRTGSFRTTRAMRRAESGVSTCGARRESDRRGRAANKEPSVKSDGISVKWSLREVSTWAQPIRWRPRRRGILFFQDIFTRPSKSQNVPNQNASPRPPIWKG